MCPCCDANQTSFVFQSLFAYKNNQYLPVQGVNYLRGFIIVWPNPCFFINTTSLIVSCTKVSLTHHSVNNNRDSPRTVPTG